MRQIIIPMLTGLVMILLGVVILAPETQTASAAAITVDSLADTTTAGDGNCTLREALTNATSDSDTTSGDCVAGAGADTITFNVNGTITLGSTLPQITSVIIINGSGHTMALDGNNSVRVFEVTSTGNLTLDTVTVQNGNSTIGGGILSNGTVTVTASAFSGNSATSGILGYGGGIWSSGTLTVTGSTFAGNSATGSLSSDGGGVYNSGGTLTVTASTFTGNSATGGISIGGGVYNNSGTLTVTGSTFSGNSATNSGGGIYNQSGPVTVTGSTFSGNSATNGGSVYNNIGTATVTVTNSTFSGNSATNGGGILNFGAVHLAGTLFASSSCDGTGTLNDNGYNLADDGSCGFSGTGSANNVSNLNLGALSGGGPGQQVHTPLTGSAAIGAIPNGITANNNGVTLACNGSTTDQLGIPRPINTGETCTSGAVEVTPVCLTPLAISDEAELSECIAWANGNGPSLDVLALDANVTLSATLPTVTSAITLNGNGFFVDGTTSVRVFEVTNTGDFTLDTITIQNGRATGSFPDDTGGGILNFGAVTVTASTFSGNSARIGGGIYNQAGPMTVTASTFAGNSASNSGGGIYNQAGPVTVTASTFSGNSTTNSAGGIYNQSGTLTITASTFSGNSATNNAGGIYNQSGPVTVTASTFSGNSTTYNGAGIVNQTGSVTVTASTFSGNSATNGGGILNFGTIHLAGTLFASSSCDGTGTLNDNGYNLADDGSCGFSATGSANNVTDLNLATLSVTTTPGQQGHTPQTASAAIGAIPNGTSITNNTMTLACNSSTTDQLGVTRPINAGDACTSGAIEVAPPPPYDFGDAPDPTYPTLLASNGAQHTLGSGLLLGALVDDEFDGQPDATATGDDITGTNDDDGVSFTSALVVGQIANVDITASGAGVLNAWIDFNGNGSWADASEQIFTDQALVAGVNSLNFTVPASATTGNTFARFRFASTGGLTFAGLAADGEVEDYQVTIDRAVIGAAKQFTGDCALAPTLTIDYTFENFGTVTLTNLTAVDDLSAVFGTHGVDWTFTSISAVPAALANPAFNGHSVTELVNQAPTQSLTAGNVGTITVTVQLLTSGSYTNQVTGSGTTTGGLTVNDVSHTGTDPDPNGDGTPDEGTATTFSCALPGVTIGGYPPNLLIGEDGTTDTYTITLDSIPTAQVDITSTPDANCQIDGNGLGVAVVNAFTDMTPLTLTVSTPDNAVTDGNRTCTITHSAASGDGAYDGFAIGNVVADVLDNDSVGIVVIPTSGLITTEALGTDTFTIRLNSQPAGGADVTIPLSSSTPTEGTVPVSVTILNAQWQTGVLVTVTGVDDLVIDGDIAYTIITGEPTSADGVYDALLDTDVADVGATNQDNDSVVTADDDVYATAEDVTLTVDAATGVLQGDTGGNGNPLQAVLDTNPTNGTLNYLNVDGAFEYVPNPGFFGQDTFTYWATDGTNPPANATVTLNVALVNGTLMAHDDGTDMPMNTSITLNVLANDVDPDGDPLHIAGVTQPAHGQAVVDGSQIIYTPDPGYIGQDAFTYIAADDFGASASANVGIIVWQAVPLCADFDGSTNDIVRADVPGGTVTNGSVFCRILTENTVYVRGSQEVGQPEVLSRGVIQAVDAFALYHDGSSTAFLNNPVTICLQGQGALLYLDATVSPRAVVELPVFMQSGYTCGAIPNAGTVVLVGGAASVVNPAPEASAPTGPTTTLNDCMVTTRDILNLREQPNGAILRMIPYDVTLTALERTSGWFYVDYLGQRGWISAGYVTPQGTCGQ